MNAKPTDAEILSDLELCDDTGKANHYVVKWRAVGVGFIESLRRPHKKLPAKVKEIYDQNLGKWYNTWKHQGYFDTKEAAAAEVVRLFLDRNAEHEIVQAMLRKDHGFIKRWHEELAEKFKIEIVDEEPPQRRRKRRNA